MPSAPPAPAPPAAAGTAKAPGWSLRWRIASGALFLPLLVLLAHAGSLAWTAFVGLQVALGLTEFYRMMRAKGHVPHFTLGFVAALGLVAVAFRPTLAPAAFLVTFLVLVLLALGLRRAAAGGVVESMGVTAFGVLYVGWLSSHLVLLRELPWLAGTDYRDGAAYVLLAFFLTWSCDTGAYAFGRRFGRTRPWTTISPRKSVEGSAGGLLTATASAFVARAWFAPWLSAWDAVLLGLLVGVFAQVGDLVESLLKRDARAGDSSDFIPGHGGVLDRFDSLYFGAPLVYWYLRLVVLGVP